MIDRIRGKARRDQKGVTVIAFVLVAFVIILMLGLFAFDASRAQMAQREIVALCDSAALASLSMLATYDTSTPPPVGAVLADAQNGAMLYGYNMVRRGSILGQGLETIAKKASSMSDLMNCSVGEAKVLYTLVDPKNGYQSVPLGDVNGKAISMQVSYGYRPLFLGFVGLGDVTLRAESTAGLPQVDAVLVFDFSGSMDDSTKVTFVCRSWDDAAAKIKYQIVAPTSGDATLSNVVGWNYSVQPAGSPLNVLPPQNLPAANNPPATGSPLVFMPFLRANPQGGRKDYGTPPGDCTLAWPTGFGNPGTPQPHPSTSTEFTDLVVNVAPLPGTPYPQPLNGPNNILSVFPLTVKFSSSSKYEPDPMLRGRTLRFPSLAALVEAARGNLDSKTNFNNAQLNRGNTNGWAYPPMSQIGSSSYPWRRAYLRLASLYSQPLATALDGAYDGFFNKIDGLADVRYGFVGFSSAVGLPSPVTSANTSTQLQPYDFVAPYGSYGAPSIGHWWLSSSTSGTGATAYTNSLYSSPGFRLPRTPLRWNDTQAASLAAAANINHHLLNTSANGLFNGRPTSQTDTAEALATARKMFNNPGLYDIATLPSTRKASRKAIIFFTDGEPTGGISGSEASATRAEATACGSQGIAIFTIGLNVTGNGQLTADQYDFLGDDPGGSGLARLGSNGGKFFPVADAISVKKAFTAVARRLTQNQN